jgi:hypothetical protein
MRELEQFLTIFVAAVILAAAAQHSLKLTNIARLRINSNLTTPSVSSSLNTGSESEILHCCGKAAAFQALAYFNKHRPAVSLGAPFWFDLLNRLVDIRGSGRKPDKPATAS